MLQSSSKQLLAALARASDLSSVFAMMTRSSLLIGTGASPMVNLSESMCILCSCRTVALTVSASTVDMLSIADWSRPLLTEKLCVTFTACTSNGKRGTGLFMERTAGRPTTAPGRSSMRKREKVLVPRFAFPVRDVQETRFDVARVPPAWPGSLGIGAARRSEPRWRMKRWSLG